MDRALARELQGLVGDAAVASPHETRFGHDATEHQGLTGTPEAIVLPADTDAVAAVVRWCYAHGVAIVPRGGGSGFAGGCVPVDGGVVVDLGRMARVRDFEPLLWRMQVEAGLRTSDVKRLARENGLLFPPDPGAAEQSQIGGNLATNAGGPHAFKYGATGRWVTGIEAVVPPGEVVTLGGPIRKDVATYDLRGLLIGSEGTLGIITAAWLRLTPAPEAALPVVAIYNDAASGCAAIEAVLGSGVVPAALEFLDAGALRAARDAYPFDLPPDGDFLVLAEADGDEREARATASELLDALAEKAVARHAPDRPAEVAALWRWRDGVSVAVAAQLGGKVSEDIVVPVDRLLDAVEATIAIGTRHGLAACSWGHAGDGNLHSTFLIDQRDRDQVERAHAAATELCAMAVDLGGSISGEHGIGWLKRDRLDSQLPQPTLELHRTIKRTIDPKNLMNPGKKI